MHKPALTRVGALIFAASMLLAGAGPARQAHDTAGESASLVFQRAIDTLLHQKRFQISEVLHYGVLAQPERYHLRVRYIAPDRLEQERDDHPQISIQVGRVLCYGPRRWHCHREGMPAVNDVVSDLLLPGMSQVSFSFGKAVSAGPASTAGVVAVEISARGDPWQCPPFAVTCPIPGFDEQRFQDNSRYHGVMTIDRKTGLPVALVSSVTMASKGRLTPQERRNLDSPAQNSNFSYAATFGIHLPKYPRWKCPWWDPPGTWCMKEPGA